MKHRGPQDHKEEVYECDFVIYNILFGANGGQNGSTLAIWQGKRGQKEARGPIRRSRAGPSSDQVATE